MTRNNIRQRDLYRNLTRAGCTLERGKGGDMLVSRQGHRGKVRLDSKPSAIVAKATLGRLRRVLALTNAEIFGD